MRSKTVLTRRGVALGLFLMMAMGSVTGAAGPSTAAGPGATVDLRTVTVASCDADADSCRYLVEVARADDPAMRWGTEIVRIPGFGSGGSGGLPDELPTGAYVLTATAWVATSDLDALERIGTACASPFEVGTPDTEVALLVAFLGTECEVAAATGDAAADAVPPRIHCGDPAGLGTNPPFDCIGAADSAAVNVPDHVGRVTGIDVSPGRCPADASCPPDPPVDVTVTFRFDDHDPITIGIRHIGG